MQIHPWRNTSNTPSAALAVHTDLNVWEPGVISNSAFSGNEGSGLHVEMSREDQEFLLSNGYFNGNSGLGGAAILRGRSTVVDSRFYYNTCNVNNHAGGLLFSSENGVIANTEFRGNQSRWAGGLYVYDDRAARISDCEFNHNTAEFMGGGAALSNNASLLERCSFTTNTAVFHPTKRNA